MKMFRLLERFLVKVTLPCVVSNKRGLLQWTKDGFGLGKRRELPGFPRYGMREGGGGDCDLRISPVLPSDEASYQCQVGATESTGPIRSKYSVVSVSAPPQPPVITAGPLMLLREGKIALVQCISKGGSSEV